MNKLEDSLYEVSNSIDGIAETMTKETCWEVFHGKDLDKVVDRAHETAPLTFSARNVDVKFLNGEWIVTVIGNKE